VLVDWGWVRGSLEAYRSRGRGTRAALGHRVLVVHEAVQQGVVGVEAAPGDFLRAGQAAQPSQGAQAGPGGLRQLERSVRRDILRRLCKPSEALPTF
jgi:hypothetical protein